MQVKFIINEQPLPIEPAGHCVLGNFHAPGAFRQRTDQRIGHDQASVPHHSLDGFLVVGRAGAFRNACFAKQTDRRGFQAEIQPERPADGRRHNPVARSQRVGILPNLGQRAYLLAFRAAAHPFAKFL